MFKCLVCEVTFTHSDSLSRHVKSVHTSKHAGQLNQNVDYPDFDCRLKAPFALIVSGLPQSGRSTITAKLLAKKDDMIYPSPKSVIWCYTEVQPKLFVVVVGKVENVYSRH